MGIVDDLSDLFTDTLQHAPLLSRDSYGKRSYDTAVAYSCRLVRTNKKVRDFQGHEVVSTAHVWIKGTPAVSPDDRITLSDGVIPQIAMVERFQDADGPSHTKVYFL